MGSSVGSTVSGLGSSLSSLTSFLPYLLLIFGAGAVIYLIKDMKKWINKNEKIKKYICILIYYNILFMSYKNSKVYKIINSLNDNIYIGSTTEGLSKRF